MKHFAFAALLLTTPPAFADNRCFNLGDFGELAMKMRIAGISEAAVLNRLSQSDFVQLSQDEQEFIIGAVSTIYDVEPDGMLDDNLVEAAGAFVTSTCHKTFGGRDGGYIALEEPSFPVEPSAPAYAPPAYSPPVNQRWIVVASRATQHEAIDLARAYSHQFPTTQVFLAKTGWFAVSVGSAPANKAPSILSDLKGNQEIPRDSYLLPMQRYHTPIWAAVDAGMGN